eukprot:m.161133 g.161133  ORF g.161133 m.161133 type:complete len:122 (-) comp24842_c0_seq4:212-577(-)
MYFVEFEWCVILDQIAHLYLNVNSNLIQETTSSLPSPDVSIQREPVEGRPEFIVLEIALPSLKSTKTATLDMSEDRLVLHAPKKYHLDMDFDWPVDCDDVGAQFDRQARILTVTCPIKRPD